MFKTGDKFKPSVRTGAKAMQEVAAVIMAFTGVANLVLAICSHIRANKTQGGIKRKDDQDSEEGK
jgi:hypothetical protein